MALRGRKKAEDPAPESVADYRFDAKRANNSFRRRVWPPTAQGKLEEPRRIRYGLRSASPARVAV